MTAVAAFDSMDRMPYRLEPAAAPRLVSDDGRTLPLAPRDALLLAWLALEGPTSRGQLARLLWPASEDVAARNVLRQRLFNLRKQCGGDLVAGSTTLELAAGVTHDLEDADGVLAGLADAEADGELAQWLALQRGRRRDRLRQSLAELADSAAHAGDWPDALGHANELLALDPLSEDAHRRVMRLHYLAGDRAAVLLAFDACERMLKDEVGTRPSTETLMLLAQAESAAPPSAVPPLRNAALLRPPRLVGREEAWRELSQAFEASQVLVIEGEAGMGKSRLVGDFVRQLPRECVVVGARPGDVTAPYASIVRLLRVLVQRVGEPPAALRRSLARWLPELGDAGPAPADAARLHAALLSFVASAATAGVRCVLVEDLHAVDAASAEALHFLAGAVQPQAWVFTTRPDLPRRLPEVPRAVLAPLSEAQVAELVDSIAVPGWSGPALAPRLLRHTGGNPLFVLETLKSMPVGVPGPALPAAPSVTQLIGQRVRHLSSEALRIARCAALADPDFSVELATRLLGAGPLDLADAWAELEGAHVLRDQVFAHDLIRDAVRASVPAPLARDLHRRIAEFLEARGAPPQSLAAHWQASDSPERAVPHLLRAGRQAVALLRWDEGADALLAAADLLERGGEHDAAFDAVNAFFEHVRSPEGAAHERLLQRLEALAATPIQRASAAERRAGALIQRGDFAGAGAVAETALAGFAHAQAPALAAMLLTQARAGYMHRGDNDAAVRSMYRAVALAETSGDEVAQHRAVAALAAALSNAGRTAEAEPQFVRSLELAKRTDSPMEIVEAALELTTLHQATGHIAEARRSSDLAEQVAARHELDIDGLWPWMPLKRVRLALQQASYREAVAGLEHAKAVLAERMPGWSIAFDNVATALWMQLGQLARARQASQAALGHVDGALPLYAAQARALAVTLDLDQGQDGQALAVLDEAQTRLAAGSARAGLQLALVRARLLSPEQALAAACQIAEAARSGGWLGHALDAEVMACEFATRAADGRAASLHAQAALGLFETVEPASLYRARVWLAAARALVGDDAARSRRLVQQAVHWVQESALQRVPPEFRDSFLQRNPVNRELLAMASRGS